MVDIDIPHEDWLESETFYNAMQGYRLAPRDEQREVVAHFENVKRLIRQHFQAQATAEPVAEAFDTGTEFLGLRWIPFSGTPRVINCGDKLYTRPAPLADRAAEPVVGHEFVRAWLELDRLPGGMMSSNDGLYGPIAASTSCWLTTSESDVKRMRADGRTFIEVWRPPTPPAAPTEKRCPQCGSREVYEGHHQGSFAVPECSFFRCDDCDHQWGHQ